MPAQQRGWLVLADVSGYTAFLAGAELDHAHDVLSALLKRVMRALGHRFRIVKLEGDAVFAWAPEALGRAEAVRQIENAFHAFRVERQAMRRGTSCTCRACAGIGTLDLKFVAHRGEFLVHDLAGHEDLVGSDVILVHRLLKNEVAERHGTRAYLLLTRGPGEGETGGEWRPHAEEYEHLGSISGEVLPLEPIYEERERSGAEDLREDQADAVAVIDLPIPPEEAWAWQLDDALAVRWQGGLTAWTSGPRADGRMGPGAEVHCAHGSQVQRLEIRSWRPYDCVTVRSEKAGPLPAHTMTMRFEATDGGRGTRLHWWFRDDERTWWSRLRMVFLRRVFVYMGKRDGDKLRRILADERAVVKV